MESVLTPVLNHLLAQHTWAGARLRPHAGRQAQLGLSGLSLRFRITSEGQVEPGDSEAVNDVTIELSSDALKALGDGIDGVMAHVRITGNADFADALSFVARHLRWDREADLARVFGPIVGRRLHLGARQMERLVPDTGRRIMRNATEYLIHEGDVLVAREEVESHIGQLRRLRDDLARVQQRVDRLSRKAG